MMVLWEGESGNETGCSGSVRDNSHCLKILSITVRDRLACVIGCVRRSCIH